MKEKIYRYFCLIGGVCAVSFFLLLLLLIVFQRNPKLMKLLVPLILASFILTVVLGLIFEVFFSKIRDRKLIETTSKPGYSEKMCGIFLPVVISLFVTAAVWSHTRNLPITMVAFPAVFLLARFMVYKYVLAPGEEFKKKLAAIGLEARGSCVPYMPMPLYGEGMRNGAKVRVGMITEYGRKTTATTVVAVLTDSRRSFSLTKTRKAGANNLSNFDDLLNCVKLKSENPDSAKVFIGRNFETIKGILGHTSLLYLGGSLNMQDNGLFSGDGMLGAVMKDEEIARTLDLLVILSKELVTVQETSQDEMPPDAIGRQ